MREIDLTAGPAPRPDDMLAQLDRWLAIFESAGTVEQMTMAKQFPLVVRDVLDEFDERLSILEADHAG